MRTKHVYDASYVFHYILDLLYCFETINVKNIAIMFDYDISSIYKILKKIEYNQILINSSYELIKVKTSCYRFTKT